MFLEIIPFVPVEAFAHLWGHVRQEERLVHRLLRSAMVSCGCKVTAVVAAPLNAESIADTPLSSTYPVVLIQRAEVLMDGSVRAELAFPSVHGGVVRQAVRRQVLHDPVRGPGLSVVRKHEVFVRAPKAG